MRRRNQLWYAAAVAIALACLATMLSPAATAASPLWPKPPAPPAPGDLGGRGPCETAMSSLANPAAVLGERVFVFEPTGAGDAPTGGRCDDAARPTIFFAHGYFVVRPSFYADLFEHWVSRGHTVVFANYSPLHGFLGRSRTQYEIVDAGFQAAADATGRIDIGDIGVAGHSFGGGMTPWLVQQAGARGWGSESLWLATLAQSESMFVDMEEIDLPDRARALVVGFEDEFIVNNQVGIDAFEALGLPDAQKEYLQVYSEVRGLALNWATHHVPMTIFSASASIRNYAVLRPIDALSECVRTGVHCDADLSWMGVWSDGVDARRTIATDDPHDFGLL